VMNITPKPILVVGGGISGITIATELAEIGKEVILIEREPFLGGNVIKMNNYFPKLCPPSCGLEINFRRIKQNSGIKIITSSYVSKITGEKGNFAVTVESDPKYVNENCTACGECEKVCPYYRPNDFNNHFDETKCIYLPHEMAFPYRYCLDDMFCNKEECSLCQAVCKYNAINLEARKEKKTIDVCTIVFATGWMPYDMLSIENLNGGRYENIVNNLDMERLLAPNGPGKGKVYRPTDGSEPKHIIFVQCAGSRDENNLPYCSSVCCSASLKQALSFREKYPDSTVKIFYIDLRVSGRNEDFLVRAQSDKGIEFIKGKVGKIKEDPDTKDLCVEAEDVLSGKKKKHMADLVVLATGIYPNFLHTLKLKQKPSGFYSENQQDGIFVASCARKPMDVASSIKDATAIALKALIASL
jgi:quinone-modifying oxidoreductase subunit QmoA